MKKSKIYIKDWLEFKPYEIENNVDLYYLKIANEIYQVFSKKEFDLLNIYLNEDQKKIASCFLTCYFEDIISETNFWFAFKHKYNELYDKVLPFFSINKDEYIDEEFNLEDIAFLLWYFINSTDDDYFMSPYNDIFLEIAEKCMEVFEKHYEYTPENKQLKNFFSLNEYDDYNSFYQVRDFIQRVVFESYLFTVEFLGRKLEEGYEVLLKPDEEDLKLSYLREIDEAYTFNKKTALLALKPKEWTSLVLGKSHPLYNDILEISDKVQGSFFYKKQNNTTIFLEHIASNKIFEVTKKSFDNYNDLKEDKIIFIGLVKWKNEWWFSGNYTTFPFNADYILDLKNSIKERANVNFLQDKKAIDKNMKLFEEAFLKFNKNSLVAIMKENQIQNFIDNFIESYHDNLKLTKKEKEQANASAKKDGFFGGKNSNNLFNNFEKGNDLVVVFCNPKGGLEFYFEIDKAFSITKFSSDIEVQEEITRLLMSDEYSTELVHYFLDKNLSKVKILQEKPFKQYIDNLDFLLRFWKVDNYETIPKQTIIETKKE